MIDSFRTPTDTLQKDLAEGWYDPATKQKADQQAAREPLPARFVNSFEQQPQESEELANDGSIQADDYEVGPAAPSYAGSMSRSGPSAPNRQDLQYRDGKKVHAFYWYPIHTNTLPEIMMENRLAMRDEIRNERKLERRQEKERMEELVPRADAGTRERQLEKKQDINAARASYREANESGDQEVPESELLGDDGFDSYKRKKNEEEKKKTERQIRKEEIWRAKAEERREKLDEMRMKEDKTLEMLKALAKQRYGWTRRVCFHYDNV